MINLLPPGLKQEYRYARLNRRLLQWVVGFLLAIAGVAVLTIAGLIIMSRSIDARQTEVTQTKAHLASQDIADTQKQISAIASNLKLMVSVLSKEVLFSELLVQLGSVTPPNTALSSLSVSQTQGAVDIAARAKNYDAATQLQANLADPNNKIFSKADTVDISCSTTVTGIYPCTITLKALFAANNPYLFINTKAGK